MSTRVKETVDTLRVLLVDDDREFARLVAEFLDAEGGFAVEMRSTGAVA